MTRSEFADTAEAAAHRGARWLAGRQNADGSLGGGAGIRTMYKTLAALSSAGQLVAAGRLADWLRDEAQRTPGVFEHPDPDAPPNQNLYTDCWILLGAQRLGRFELAGPAAVDRVQAEQHDCGGFSMAPLTAERRSLDPTSTTLAGIVLLGAGRFERAELAGRFLLGMLEQQPEPSEAFWCLCDAVTGQLITDHEPNQKILACVSYAEPRQLFFHLGAPAVLLGDLAAATGDAEYAHGAASYAALAERICPAGRSFTCSCKCAWGVARTYAVTRDNRWAAPARGLATSVFLDLQSSDGSWPPPTIPLSDDASVSRTLTSDEITAEFTYELAMIAADLAV